MAEANTVAHARVCEHVRQNNLPPSMFCKRKVWVKAYDTPDPRFQQVDLVQPCIICDQLYNYWAEYASSCLISWTRDLTADTRSTTEREDDSVINADPLYHQSDTLEPGLIGLLSSTKKASTNTIFAVKLVRRQLGEAYHVLICRFLLWGVPGSDIRIEYIQSKAQDETRRAEENRQMQEIEDLFKWYRIEPKASTSTGAHDGGKRLATSVIADAFRYANKPKGRGEVRLNQPALFQLIRRQLNSSVWPYKIPDETVNIDLAADYFWPSYAAKYWLNRYLRLTNQSTLPKRIDVGRIAVVHVRGKDALSSVKREMDGATLEYVAQSIRDANLVSDQARKISTTRRRFVDEDERTADQRMHRFTHVILYGDFDYSEGVELKRKVENNTGDLVEVMFISRPWENREAVKTHRGKDLEVDEFWDKFRDHNFDHLPIQVKILSIWTALCQRYHPKICVVGHRSGFIEGAGLIGIPIFYLNNERDDIKGNYGPGDLLWQRIDNRNERPQENTQENQQETTPQLSRLRSLSDVMNTIIPIECLHKPPSSPDILRIDTPKYQDELPAALFIYMLADLGTGEKELSSVNRMSPGENPAWIARVDMQHHTCREEGHSPGLECEDDLHNVNDAFASNGQEWLRRRYEFAVDTLEQLRKGVSPDRLDSKGFRFSRWTGVQRRWPSKPREAGDVGETSWHKDRELWPGDREGYEDPVPLAGLVRRF